jgi:hypothetical protein
MKITLIFLFIKIEKSPRLLCFNLGWIRGEIWDDFLQFLECILYTERIPWVFIDPIPSPCSQKTLKQKTFDLQIEIKTITKNLVRNNENVLRNRIIYLQKNETKYPQMKYYLQFWFNNLQNVISEQPSN